MMYFTLLHFFRHHAPKGANDIAEWFSRNKRPFFPPIHPMKSTIALFAFVALLALTGCKPEYQDAQADLAPTGPKVTPVQTETPVLSDEALPVNSVGMLSSSQETKHSFKIGGIIQHIYVDEGDYFRAGQTLAVLELKEIDAQVFKAQEGLNKLMRDEKRVSSLYNDSAATLEQLQDINTALEVAKADLDIASYNRQYAKIVARQSGKVLMRFAEEGELVSPGMPILMSSNQGQGGFVLKVGLADKDVVRILPGDSGSVSFDALAEGKIPAMVTNIATQATPGVGTFEVELLLSAPDQPLRNGFVGVAEIFPRSNRSYYKLPLEAIVEADGKEASIYLADTASNQAKLQNLSLAAIGDDFVLVDTTDLNLNSPVITSGAGFLRPNAKISIQ